MGFELRKFKLGLDVHGVIDDNPQMFSDLTKRLFRSGDIFNNTCEIHVITGAHATEDLIDRLRNVYKIEYTHIYSIADYHKEKGTNVWYDKKNTPWMESVAWDTSKADYCRRNNIDLHIDDTERYGRYFTTPFLLYSKKTSVF